jgi:outer membrane usher protein
VFSGGTGRRAAQVNGFGPGIVPQIGQYWPDTITFNLLNPPVGYDVGAGKYQTNPGAYTGAHIQIGTDAYHSAVMTLLSPDASRLSLRYGTVRRSDGVETPIFTNGSGRAVIGDLAAGEYVIELDGRYRAKLTIAKDAPAVIEMGDLVMEKMQ